MPRDNRAPPVKLYYRIGEVAELVGVEPHVLRYWESEFPTIRPQKSRSGQRVYSRRDVDKLLRVKDLLYAQRFTIAGARQRLRGTSTEISESEAKATSVAMPSSAPFVHQPVADASTASRPAAEGTVTATATALRATLLSVRSELLDIIQTLGVPSVSDDESQDADS